MALTKIPNNLIAADAITGTLIADDAINSEHIADGAIDAAHMSANSIDSDSYVDGSIDRAHISDDAINSEHIANEVVNSYHYVPGSIDTAHIGDDQVTAAKLANSINTSIAAKLPLAGGTLTGAVALNQTGSVNTVPLAITSNLNGGQSLLELRTTGNSPATIDLRADGTGDPQIFFDLNGATAFAIGVDNSDSDKFKISGNYQLGTNARIVIDSSGNVLIGQTSSVTNGKLQVTGGIGLTGNSTIRSSTNSDNGDTIKFFGTQMVAGSNSHTYSYSEGGYIASLATAGNAILLDAGNTTADTGHRFRVKNAGNGVDGSIQYLDGTTSRFHVDSSTGIIKENDIPVRSRAIAMAMVFG